MRKFLRLFPVAVLLAVLLVVPLSHAADFTKTQGELLDWTVLDDTLSDNPFAESTIQTFPDELEVILHIVVAHTDTNDASANFVTISVIGRVGADNEGWRQLALVQAGGGQATAETLNANSGSSEVGDEDQLHVADTTDFDTGTAQWLFLKDSGTLVNSALCLVKGWVDATHYLNAWDLVGAYDNADILYDAVSVVQVRLSASIQFANITFHNSDSAANYAVRVDYTAATDIQ